MLNLQFKLQNRSFYLGYPLTPTRYNRAGALVPLSLGFVITVIAFFGLACSRHVYSPIAHLGCKVYLILNIESSGLQIILI